MDNSAKSKSETASGVSASPTSMVGTVPREPNKIWRALLLILIMVPLLTGVIFYCFLTEEPWTFKVERKPGSGSSPDDQMTKEGGDEPALQANIELIMSSDEPGIKNGRFYNPEEVVIPEETMIIGVEVDGQFRAYLPGGMNSMDQHILHDDFNGQPITVTYCDKSDCARAFVRGDLDPDQIRMGGFNGKAMWLLIDEERYIQEAAELPLEDYPITRVTWESWKSMHPETTIYVGIGLVYAPTLRDGDDQLPRGEFYQD